MIQPVRRGDKQIQRAANRRDFLKTSVASLGGLALPAALPLLAKAASGSQAGAAQINALLSSGKKSVVLLNLAGGPSHLDMYDMKPSAPAEIRGEFRPINTNVPGMQVCEYLPLHAKIADKFAIVNGVQTIDSHSPAIVSTGALASDERPSLLDHQAVAAPPLELPHGDWDTHGRVLGRKLSIFQELRAKLPAYDRIVHDLVTGIYDRGLDQDVLLVAWGEFGRTPWINQYAGRNHWASCGSVLFAGGGLKMGQTIGNTGPIGEREQSRSQPYTAENVLATIYRHLGVPESTQPIAELF
jgi:hypothetical protein